MHRIEKNSFEPGVAMAHPSQCFLVWFYLEAALIHVNGPEDPTVPFAAHAPPFGKRDAGQMFGDLWQAVRSSRIVVVVVDVVVVVAVAVAVPVVVVAVVVVFVVVVVVVVVILIVVVVVV